MDKTTESVWQEMRRPLQRYVAGRIRNVQDREDVLQNIFCKIHVNIDRLQDATRIQAWVFQITRNALIDFYRTQRPGSSLSELPAEVAVPAETEPELLTEVIECIKTIVANMPEKYRSAIELAEFAEISQTELARQTGLSLSGAKSRVQRGRRKLKEILLDCCKVELDNYGNILEYRRNHSSCKYC